jgi:hypothetical protein
MPVTQLANLKLRIIVDGPRSTAHLIEPQTFISLFMVKKRIIRNSKIRLGIYLPNRGSCIQDFFAPDG